MTSQINAGDGPNAALHGNIAGQSVRRHADTHSALDNGQ
jgi:hypothetical protein